MTISLIGDDFAPMLDAEPIFKRWNIENRGFNELVTGWEADHVYKHDPVAILNFWLAT